MVKRWGNVGAVSTAPAKIMKKWGKMVTKDRSREQSSDCFFSVRFGELGTHLQRLADATPRLQARAPGSTQSTVPLLDVWRACHNVLPPPPLPGPGSLDLLESAPSPDALHQMKDHPLKHGDALVMRGSHQQTHQRRVPAGHAEAHPTLGMVRHNLAFRRLL